MIAAAMQFLSLNKMPFGWFDAVLLVALGFGLFRGRKNGLTKEILPTLQWIVIVVVSGFGYGIVGGILSRATGLRRPTACVLGYLILALVVWFVFVFIRKKFEPRLEGSTVFGAGEFYLGMLSGMVRLGCILLFVMALLNAPVYSAADIEAHAAYVKRWYGGGIYSGNYFPTLQGVQASVFKSSLTGPHIKNYLGALLININSTNGLKKTPPSQAQSFVHIGN